jgi:hypothetical protein
MMHKMQSRIILGWCSAGTLYPEWYGEVKELFPKEQQPEPWGQAGEVGIEETVHVKS